MHHYLPSYNDLWIFLVAAVILICALIYLTPMLMNYLDKYEENRRKPQSPEKKKDE